MNNGIDVNAPLVDSVIRTYQLLDDLLWDFFNTESREEVRTEYRKIMDLNHEAFYSVQKNDILKSVEIMRDVLNRFNELQNEFGTLKSPV